MREVVHRWSCYGWSWPGQELLLGFKPGQLLIHGPRAGQVVDTRLLDVDHTVVHTQFLDCLLCELLQQFQILSELIKLNLNRISDLLSDSLYRRCCEIGIAGFREYPIELACLLWVEVNPGNLSAEPVAKSGDA